MRICIDAFFVLASENEIPIDLQTIQGVSVDIVYFCPSFCQPIGI